MEKNLPVWTAILKFLEYRRSQGIVEVLPDL